MSMENCIKKIDELNPDEQETIIAELRTKGGSNVSPEEANEILKNSLQQNVDDGVMLERQRKTSLDALEHQSNKYDNGNIKGYEYLQKDILPSYGKLVKGVNMALTTQQSSMHKRLQSSYLDGIGKAIANNPEGAANLGVKKPYDTFTLFNNAKDSIGGAKGWFMGSRKYNAKAYKSFWTEVKRLNYARPKPPPKGTNEFITAMAQNHVDTQLNLLSLKNKYGRGAKQLQGRTVSHVANYSTVMGFSKPLSKRVKDTFSGNPLGMRRRKELGAKENMIKFYKENMDIEHMNKYSTTPLNEKDIDEMLEDMISDTLAHDDLIHIRMNQGIVKPKHRNIHFKPEVEYKVDERLGHNLMYDMYKDIERTAMVLPVYKMYGGQPDFVFDEMVKHITNKLGTFEASKQQLTLKMATDGWSLITGRSRRIAQGGRWMSGRTLAGLTDIVTTLAVAKHMPKFSISALILDLGTIPLEFYKNNIGPFLATKVAWMTARMGKVSRWQTKRDLNLVNESESGSIASLVRASFSSDSNVSALTNKLKRFLVHYSGLAPLTDLYTNYSIRTLAAGVSQKRSFSYDKLPKDFKAKILSFDIDKKAWDLIRQHSTTYEGGFEMVTPNDIMRLTPAKIRNTYGKNLTDGETFEIKDELYNMYNNYLQNSSESAVIKGDANTSNWSHRGMFKSAPLHQSGTALNTGSRMLTQLVQHPHAYTNKIIKSTIANYSGAERVALLAGLAAYSAFGGYAVYSLKNIDLVAFDRKEKLDDFWDNPMKYMIMGGVAGAYEVGFQKANPMNNHGGYLSVFAVSGKLLFDVVNVITQTMGISGSEDALEDGLAMDSAIKLLGDITSGVNVLGSAFHAEFFRQLRELMTEAGWEKVEAFEDWQNSTELGFGIETAQDWYEEYFKHFFK